MKDKRTTKERLPQLLDILLGKNKPKITSLNDPKKDINEKKRTLQ